MWCWAAGLLALAEKLDALNRVAAVAARLGRRCTLPALLGFDHVYADLLAVASPSEATALVRKLDRLAAAMAALYAELEALADLEQSARKLPTDEARRALLQGDRASGELVVGTWSGEWRSGVLPSADGLVVVWIRLMT
ncbi:hypothetical protein E2562_027486 [Oryza meyeriana var. granulata]|uniref:Rx N-terminal domain-containing protein n=1 Tax=Oryza meyeriana var. granulata TaxID=110450 RepID=A0A6G1E1C8_9ORYZ|nr:hypothetical protein E2562_027486 [Oryza meyeriana var. granulata]